MTLLSRLGVGVSQRLPSRVWADLCGGGALEGRTGLQWSRLPPVPTQSGFRRPGTLGYCPPPASPKTLPLSQRLLGFSSSRALKSSGDTVFHLGSLWPLEGSPIPCGHCPHLRAHDLFWLGLGCLPCALSPSHCASWSCAMQGPFSHPGSGIRAVHSVDHGL